MIVREESQAHINMLHDVDISRTGTNNELLCNIHRCSAGVFCVAVRPYHPTPPTTALAEGAGASRVQACRPCLHGKNCFFESNKFNLRKSIYLGQIKNLLNVNKV